MRDLKCYLRFCGILRDPFFVSIRGLGNAELTSGSSVFVLQLTAPMDTDYAAYQKGVTVEADGASPTGFTATFVYDAPQGISKAELYSDCFLLFDPEEEERLIDPSFSFPPEGFRPGLVSAGGSAGTTYYVEMENFSGNLWGARLPLPSGSYVYNFRVTYSDGRTLSRLDDPSNPSMRNDETGTRSLSSIAYVPYSAEKMGTGPWADRSVELPAPERSGKVDTVSYKGADGTMHGLAVYLPYGYDKRREVPYKVLYLSHGTSGDVYGNELRWMHEGAVRNILDNLIASGKTEPFVVVTMNNQQYSKGEGHKGPDWDFSLLSEDFIKHVLPYTERHYNVSPSPGGRAFAGLSMGGATASNMLMYHPELFSYYGIWSYANVDGSLGPEGIEDRANQRKLEGRQVKVMLAAGRWDFGLEAVREYGAYLREIGLEHKFLIVPAAHDWECWKLIFAEAAEKFFWK